MSAHYNNVAQAVSGTPGTGTITLASAVTGAQTLGAAAGGNATVDVFITDGSAWEVARNCTYTHSGTTLTRGTLEASSTGSALSLTSAAVVRVAMPASTGNAIENKLGAWGALDGENSITGTATAVIGRLNVCSGTSADYTVTLPAVSGNAGRYLGLRMAAGLTRLVTIDGNASETIDGQTTRVMWAQETALLYCDGTTWTKMAGKSRAMMCIMAPSANGTASAAWGSRVSINTAVSDNTGRMADTTNFRIYTRRTGTYVFTPLVRLNSSGTSIVRWASGIYRDRGGVVTEWLALAEQTIAAIGSYAGPTAGFPLTAEAGDFYELYVYNSGSSQSFAGSGDTENTFLSIAEQSPW